MDYIKARTYIDESHRFGGEMGLEAITCLLEKTGESTGNSAVYPYRRNQWERQCWCVSGSSPSGSRLPDRQIYLPTLYEYRERIQMNGVYIEEEAFGRLMDPVVKAIGELEEEHKRCRLLLRLRLPFLFLYYKEKKCDFVLLECGMGGKTDATNVIRNTKLAVITSISMDHMEYLGNTLGEIAGQKAGIIKPGSRVVTADRKKRRWMSSNGKVRSWDARCMLGIKQRQSL